MTAVHAAPGAARSRAPSMNRVAVGIATRGRPAVLAAILDHVRTQSLQPDTVVVAATDPADVGDIASDDPRITVLIGPPGLTRQRNAVLDCVERDSDIIVFFDDDFVPAPGWLAAAATYLAEHPTVACVTGAVLADGIKGPGLTVQEAQNLLRRPTSLDATRVVDAYSPYGCNMAFRTAAIRGQRFDERLVLYGWLEDRDFGGGLRNAGWDMRKINTATGVHLGVKSGRVAGRRLGYSQVSNPLYLQRKGTMTWRDVVDHVCRNILANLAGSLRPEPFIDRRGRLAGNLIALADALRGRTSPERAQEL